MTQPILFPTPSGSQLQQFEVGKSYSCKSPGDQDCIFEFEILKRTAKTITIQSGNDKYTRRIRIQDDIEVIDPLGSYSLSPVLRASGLIEHRGGARENAGRKALPVSLKRQPINVKIDPAAKTRLKELADHYNLSQGKLFDYLILNHKPKTNL